MMKRIILFALCLVMAVSACLAEGIPEKANRYKAKMFNEIPEKTMKKLFTEYMAQGYKVEYDSGRAWCPDLMMSGEGTYPFFGDTEESEQIRACREIAEKLYRAVYPGCEPELLSATSWRDYNLRELTFFSNMELKDGQWHYLGVPITHEMEGALKLAGLLGADRREKAEAIDPSWIILHYQPGPVGGLPVGMDIWPTERYCNNYACVTTFIFDGNNRIISADMGGGFTAEPVKETGITVSQEDALRIARDYLAEQKAEHPTQYGFNWGDYVGEPYAYDALLKELGYSSIRSELVLEEDSGRLVMFMDSKWHLQPAWEFHESMNIFADGQVVQDHFQGGMSYTYVSAEDGTPGLESRAPGV